MSDIRIEYLKLTDNRPSANSAVVSSIFMYVTMVGLALEKDNSKSIPLRLWLAGVIIQTVVQSTLKVFQGRMRGMGNNITHEEIATISRTVDNIQLASYVWFALGNILFLESHDCRSESPFVYFLCVMYFSVSYAALFTFHIVQISLIVWPPAGTEDRLYWMQNRFIYPENDVDELIPTLREYPIYTQTNTSAKLPATGLTQQQTLFWTEWLASHGCVAGAYVAVCTPTVDTPYVGKTIQTRNTDDVNQSDTNPSTSQLLVTLGTSTGNLLHKIDDNIGNADAELCSICLLELVTSASTPQSHHTWNNESPSPTLPSSYFIANMLYCATCTTLATAGEDVSTLTTQPVSNTVRYPCAGKHYFHAQCLHSWMQSATERKWDLSGRERLEYARCPYCRQAPCT